MTRLRRGFGVAGETRSRINDEDGIGPVHPQISQINWAMLRPSARRKNSKTAIT